MSEECSDFSNRFYVQTDTSDFGLAAVLTQFHDDSEKVICYLSRSQTEIERRYSVSEKKLLGVVFAVEKLRGYHEGSQFTVITDHYFLKWLFSTKTLIGRIARWAGRLQQYDFEIVQRKYRLGCFEQKCFSGGYRAWKQPSLFPVASLRDNPRRIE